VKGEAFSLESASSTPFTTHINNAHACHETGGKIIQIIDTAGFLVGELQVNLVDRGIYTLGYVAAI
jgi:hypothetical protein